MTDIHDMSFGVDVEHDAVHDADEWVLQSEIGGEGEDTRLAHDRKLFGCGARVKRAELLGLDCSVVKPKTIRLSGPVTVVE